MTTPQYADLFIVFRLRDAMTDELVAEFALPATPAGWSTTLALPATADTMKTRKYRVEIITARTSRRSLAKGVGVMTTSRYPRVVNPEAIGDPNRTPIVQMFQDDEDPPMCSWGAISCGGTATLVGACILPAGHPLEDGHLFLGTDGHYHRTTKVRRYE